MRERNGKDFTDVFLRIIGDWRQWVGDLAGGLRFFTRLPVPRMTENDDPRAIPDFASAARMLPLVGVVAALPMAICLWFLSFTDLPALVIASLAVALSLITTGGFHEDGLADVADGFGGGATLDKKLSIMRDSRIGTFGASALILNLILRISAISALLGLGGWIAAALVVIGAAVSRTCTVWIWHLLDNVRSDGKSTAAGRPSRSAALIATGICALVTVAAFFVLAPAQILISVVLAAIATTAFAAVAIRQIGGQTGDVLGASQQIAELAFLIGLLI